MRIMLFPTSKLGAALDQFIQQTSWVEHVTFERLQLYKCGGQNLSKTTPLAQFTFQHRLQQTVQRIKPNILSSQLMHRASQYTHQVSFLCELA